MKNDDSLRRPDGALVFSQRDFILGEMGALSAGVLLCAALYPLLSANGLMTSGILSASFLLCVAFTHFMTGMLLTNRSVRRSVEVISALHGGLDTKAKLFLRREAVVVKGYSSTAGLLKAVNEDGLALPDDKTYQDLLREIAQLEKKRLYYWVALPLILLLPTVFFLAV